MAKVAIVGAGQVGATAGAFILEKGLADVVLIDVVEGLPQGKALDLMEATPLLEVALAVSGSNDIADAAGADVVVLTAGLPRRPGMTRMELASSNAKIVREALEALQKAAPGAIIIVVTNPLDVMVRLALDVTGATRGRVLGMGGVLDSARMRYFLAELLEVPPAGVEGMVIGEHGENMLPLLRLAAVGGIPVSQLLSAERLEEVAERTRNGGAEIVSYLKTGSAFYAPGASIAAMVEAVLRDEGTLLPCCVRLEGEYGLRDVCLGVPVRLGSQGVTEVVELELTDPEMAVLERGAAAVARAWEEATALP